MRVVWLALVLLAAVVISSGSSYASKVGVEMPAEHELADSASEAGADAAADASIDAAEEAEAEAEEDGSMDGIHLHRFSQSEAEAEAEAELESELDTELQADMEADLAAEAEAGATTRTAVRAEHRALNEEAARRFMSEAHWFSWNDARTAHTDLTNLAVESVIAEDSQETVDRIFNRVQLLNGVQWNDMPAGSDAHPSDEPLGQDAFHSEYTYHGKHTALVHNTHFGCLQHFHSQCPSVQRLDLQNEYGDDRYVFTNTDVRGFIVDQLRYWWRTAVEQQQQNGGGPTKRAPKPKKAAAGKPAAAAAAAADAADGKSKMPTPTTPNADVNFLLGHILATVQDSWTKSHVLRSLEGAPTPAGTEVDSDDKGHTMAEKCGHVYYFQGADAQEGNTAKPLESATGSSDFYTCAHYYSYIILKSFVRCATAKTSDEESKWCAFESTLEPIIRDDVYPIASGHENSPAGGSIAQYASPRIAKLGYKAVDYTVPEVGVVSVFEPTSGKMWNALGADDLQVSLCHTVKGKVKDRNGVTYSKDEIFTEYKQQTRGGRLLDNVKCSVANVAQITTGPFYVLSKTGACERHGWRLSSGCGTHHSCRPVKSAGGCPGRCLCGTKGTCRCVVRLDKTRQQCKGTIAEQK